MFAMRSEKLVAMAGVICTIVIQFPCYSNSQQCTPSSCGNIHNISHPFRLNTDPLHCGLPAYNLTCEHNRTVLTLYSQKFYVQAINYANHTIRMLDPSVCSFPRHTLPTFTFNRCSDRDPYQYMVYKRGGTVLETAVPITFVSCQLPMNSSAFVQTNNQCSDKTSAREYTYATPGDCKASDLGISCGFEFITMTSYPIPENITHFQIHEALMYGFELSWYRALCSPKCSPSYARTKVADDVTKEVCCLWDVVVEMEIRCLSGIQVLAVFIIGEKIVIGIPFVIVLIIVKVRRRHVSVFDAIENFLSTENNMSPIRYHYKHIKNMTKGFKEKLGEGGFGSVYKGNLRSGPDVAIKIINKRESNGQDFMNEVASIGRIHHVNVVRLVGYCAENSYRALVYDFMPNGSLDKHLNTEGSTVVLNWERKFEIALGVARGIEYLHRGCDIQILHFDIKPHNVLLDHNFVPKISDFGLAKLFPTDKSIVTLTAARGTIGYVAPELINRSIGAVSYKADVYSFGMLLMEMLGLKGTPPVAEQGQSSQYFPSWIYNDMNKGKAIELGEEDEDQKRITKKMTIVGLWCIQTSPLPRPSMSRVVEMLEGDVQLLQMPPTHTFLSQPPIMDHTSITPDSTSESTLFLGNSSTSQSIDIIVD